MYDAVRLLEFANAHLPCNLVSELWYDCAHLALVFCLMRYIHAVCWASLAAPVLLNNETIAEVLGQCEVKLLKAFEVFEGDEEVLRMMDEAEGMRATAGEALYAVARKDDPRHSFNIRVAARSMSKINFDIDMEETLVDDDDDDERDVPDRLFLKATALQACLHPHPEDN
ncbi:hypothetical protein CBR_g17024 [Chara braunii]|uniref:Uncharacterized protein n=1 Tax=Chara braunii TaxID=69332 RepID=A0A388KUL6_CHABU|nr:hypothetical protein CBR_g17024 [Chara braunii]|eukprot:GBG73682.1 hypothetical protein CBR_g17024 [Chara braunii]